MSRQRVRVLARAAALGGLALGSAAWSPAATPVHGLRSVAADARAAAATMMTAASVRSEGEGGRVCSIHRYPVKSCGGEQLSEVALARLSALPGDRQFLWVDAEGKFITQRPHEGRQGNNGAGVPAMATIDASIDGASLRLSASGLEALVVPTASDEAPSRREVTLFSGAAKVVDVDGDAAGEWYCRFCGVEGARLVKADAEAATLADDWRESRRDFQAAAFAGEDAAPRTIALDDGGTILVACEASLEELNAKLGAKALPPVRMSRFRPNFVVGGLPAFDEDEWLEIRLGEVALKVERPCTRCSTVLVDQESGTSDEVNWLSKVLARFRLSKPDAAYGGFDLQGTKFGVYCTPLNAGVVRETDEVVVVRRKDESKDESKE